MSAAVLLDPYLPLETPSAEDSGLTRSTRSIEPLIRQDTPQLSLRDYQRWQYSPILSPSPELDYRRVRRKPSIQNLTGRSAQSAFSWAPSSVAPPSIHNFGPHDLHTPQPHTPQPRACTASPSLSSTITTLQSTPTHTPLFRGGSFDEQRRRLEGCALEEPIATKRKYPNVKHPRRFPRRQASSAGSQGSGVYKVFAAVFDISGEQGSLNKETGKTVKYQEATNCKRDRAVRFTGIDNPRDSSSGGTSSSDQSPIRREQTATSTFTLSKFEFPAPPNRDNWAGAFEHLPTSPSATVLYRGASFDLINPHASLLLGNNSIETPAEIDGLLDDYFEEHDDSDVMASKPGTGETSQQSLRSVSDNSKQTHTLYDDADTARRGILRIPTPTAAPSSLAPSAATMPSFAREPGPGVRPAFTPLKRSNTNPFRNKLSSIGRSIGLTTGESNHDPAEEGRAPGHADSHKIVTTAGKYEAQRHVGTKNEDGLSPTEDNRFSDPFDLSVSEARNNAELMSINGVLTRERSVMPVPASGPSDRRNALTVDDGSNTHAMSETDRDLGSIINGYDYTRETVSAAVNEPSLSSASVEHGLRDSADYTPEEKYGWATSISPGAQIRSSYHGFRITEDPEPMRPAPLASRRHGFQHHRNMPSVHREMRLSGTSDVPTSEQTYGQTDQLLLITPNVPDHLCDPLNCRKPTHIHTDGSSPLASTRYHSHDDKENTPPGLNGDGFAVSFDDAFPAFPPRMREGSVVVSPSLVHVDRDSRPSQLRASTHYADSAWETDRSESPGLTESVDLNEDGDRYSTSSNPSLNLAHSPNDYLASTSFPNLNMPKQEPSPQRKRDKGKGRAQDYEDLMASDVPAIPARYINRKQGNDHQNDERYEDGEVDMQIRRFPYVPAERATGVIPGHPDNVDTGVVDFDKQPTGDAKRALEIIVSKPGGEHIGFHRLCSPADRSSINHAKLKELELIRQRNPAAVEEAAQRFANRSKQNLTRVNSLKSVPKPSPTPAKLQQTRSPFVRPEYKPRQDHQTPRSFQNALNLVRNDAASFSSQRGLLSPHTPRHGELVYSETEDTLVTVRDNKQSAPSGERDWNPYDSSPTAQALDRMRSIRSTSTKKDVSYVPPGLRNASKPDRSAISEQHELQAFMLRRNKEKGLTDAQLARREPDWSRFPTEDSPQAKDARLLPLTHATHKEQKDISIKYLNLSVLIPFGALVFGLGGADWIIIRKTQGRIKHMGDKEKRYALLVYFPLQVLAYTILVLVAGIIIYMHYHNNDKNGGHSAAASTTLRRSNA